MEMWISESLILDIHKMCQYIAEIYKTGICGQTRVMRVNPKTSIVN